MSKKTKEEEKQDSIEKKNKQKIKKELDNLTYDLLKTPKKKKR